MTFKFEKLQVWQLALEYIDLIYEIAACLPKSEEYNLRSQIVRAATSVALNIAEGSTGQTNPEQSRFLGLAIRSLIETVACQRIIQRREYPVAGWLMEAGNARAATLLAKLHAFRNSLNPDQSTLREAPATYPIEDIPDENPLEGDA